MIMHAQMRARIPLLVLLIVLGPIGAAAQSLDRTAGGGTVVLGDVLNIENGEYVLKDQSGHEIRLRVDQSTQMADRIKVGDKVEARATNGHADSIRVRLPDDTSGRPPSGYPVP